MNRHRPLASLFINFLTKPKQKVTLVNIIKYIKVLIPVFGISYRMYGF
jgi:hypothetical protein